jgi:membrane-bound metal-dependent hydrolase YbcI (DUF457 family)
MDRWTRNATWTAVIATNLPDIDSVTQFAGTASFIDFHRGITHTIIGIPVLALILAAAMHWVSGRGRGGRGEFRKHFLIALLVMATHPILDWANTYGIRPFLPFSGRWFYGDTLFVIDLYLDAILFVGVVLSTSLVRKRVPIAIATILVALGYVGLLMGLRIEAKNQFQSTIAGQSGVIRSSVGPEFMNPFVWIGYIDTSTDISSWRIDVRRGTVLEQARLAKTPDSEITHAADSAYSAEVFHGFARFPVTRVERLTSGYRVLFIDFRFFRSSPHQALAAEVLLDNDLKVSRDSLSFVRPID